MAKNDTRTQLEILQESLDAINKQIDTTESRLKKQKAKKKTIAKKIEALHMEDVKKLMKATGKSAAELKDDLIASGKKILA